MPCPWEPNVGLGNRLLLLSSLANGKIGTANGSGHQPGLCNGPWYRPSPTDIWEMLEINHLRDKLRDYWMHSKSTFVETANKRNLQRRLTSTIVATTQEHVIRFWHPPFSQQQVKSFGTQSPLTKAFHYLQNPGLNRYQQS